MESKVVHVKTEVVNGVQVDTFFLAPKTKEEIEVEKYLDRIDGERMEWKRLNEDMYPGIKEDKTDDED